MKKIIICISIAVLAAGYFVFFGPRSKQNRPQTENTTLTTTIKEIPTSGTPDEYSDLDNLSFLVYRIQNDRQYKSTTEGEVKASVLFANYVQEVNDRKIVNKQYGMSESISISSMKSVALQKFFTPDKVLIRKPCKIDKENTIWNDSCYAIDYKKNMEVYGTTPFTLSNHILCESTILSSELKKENGDYILNLSVDPKNGPFYYKRQIMVYGGSNELPEFESIHLTLTFDEKWYIKTLVASEKYQITIPIMGSLTCDSLLTETFVHGDFAIDEFDFYKDYFSIQNTEEIVNDEEKDITTYLTSSFAPYLQGETGYFDINGSIGNQQIDGRLAMNLKDMEIDTILNIFNNDIKIKYYDNNLYYNFSNNKGYAPINSILNIINNGETSDLSFDTDALLKKFAGAELVKEKDMVSCDVNLDLANTPVSLKFVFNDNEKISLNKIVANLNLQNTDISLEMIPGNKFESLKIDNTYDNILNNSTIKKVIELCKSNAFAINVEYITDKQLSVRADLLVSLDKIATGNISVMYNNETIQCEVNYINDYFYIQTGNLKIKLNSLEALQLFGIDISLNNIDMDELLSKIDFCYIIKNLEISDIIQLALSENENFVISSEDKLNIATSNLNLNIDSANNFTIEFDKEEYVDITKLLSKKDDITNLVFNDSYNITLDTSLNINGMDITVSGNGYFNKIEMTADINVDILVNEEIINANIILKNDKVFLTIYGKTFVVNVPELLEFIKDCVGTQNYSINDIIEMFTIKSYEKELLVNVDTSSVNTDVKLLLDADKLSVYIANLKLEDVVIHNTSIELSSSEYKEIIEKEAVEINKEYLSNLLNTIKIYESYINDGFNINSNLMIKLGALLIDTHIDFDIINIRTSPAIKGFVTLQFNDLLYEIEIIYKDDVIYASLLGVNVQLHKNQINELIDYVLHSFEIDHTNDEFLKLNTSISNLVDKISINSVSSDTIHSTLLVANGNLENINLDITTNDSAIVTVSGLKYNSSNVSIDVSPFSVHLTKSSLKEIQTNLTYLTLDEIKLIIDKAKQTKDLIEQKEFNVDLNLDLYNETNDVIVGHINVNGKIILNTNGNVDLNVDVLYKDSRDPLNVVDNKFNVIMIDDYLYLTFSQYDEYEPMRVKLSLSNLIDAIDPLGKIVNKDLSPIKNLLGYKKLNNIYDIAEDIKNDFFRQDNVLFTMNFNEIIQNLSLNNNDLSLSLKIDNVFNQTLNANVTLEGTDTKINYMDGLLYLGSSKYDFDLTLLDTSSKTIEIPSENYIDMSTIAQIVTQVYQAYSYKDVGYHLSGEVILTVISIIDVTVTVDIKVKYVGQDLVVFIQLDVERWWPFIQTWSTNYITIKNEVVYMQRNWTGMFGTKGTQYRNQHIDYFLNNIWNNLYWILDLSSMIQGRINKAIGVSDTSLSDVENPNGLVNNGKTPIYQNAISRYDYYENDKKYDLLLNGGALTGNNDIGDLSVQIYHNGQNELTQLNAQLNMVKVINLNFTLNRLFEDNIDIQPAINYLNNVKGQVETSFMKV